MKLLYKEFALAAHPSLFIFTFLGCLVIVPAYPYSTKPNQFCLIIILCRIRSAFDYLIYPYYPAYTG